MRNAFMEIGITEIEELISNKPAEERKIFLLNLFSSILEHSDDFTQEDLIDFKSLIDKFSGELSDVEKTAYNEKLIKGHKLNYAMQNTKRKLNIIWS